jgi:TonB-dependent receptor
VARAMDRVFGTTTKEGPTDFSLSASAGKKGEFFGRPMAVIGGITYKRDYEMDPERIYGETTLVSGTTRTIRESEYIGRESSDNLLTAAMITAMWQPDDDDKITATVFTNLAAEDSVGFYQGETLGDIGDPTDNIPPSQADESRVREFIEYTERRLTFLQMAGSHVFEGWKGAELNWNANYGWSSQDQPDIRLSNYASLNGQAFDPVTGEFIETKVFGGVGSNFSGQPWERIWRRLEDTNYSFNMDTKLPLATEGEKEWFMRFGGGFDSSRREYRSDNYALRVPGTTFNQIPHPESLHPDNLKGFTIPDELPVKLLQNTGGDGVYLFRSSTPELYNADQQIVSMFLMTEADLSESVNIGFGGRLEKTDIQLTSPATELFGTDAATGSLLVVDPLTGEVYSQEEIESPISRSEVQLLPAASVKWMLDDNMALRFAASRTLARPTFKELAPVFTRSPGSSRRFFGNRRLQLSDITNYDLRWEWFPKPGDVIAASVFTKTIDRPIEFVNLGNFATVANEVSATVYGFELEVQKSLGDIWPMLDGFSMGTNYSWIFSSMDLTPQSQATREASGLDSRPLQGQPDYLFNWNVNYEHEDFGLTAGLFLNVTGPLLYEAGGRVLNDFGLDVYQRPVTSLDFLLSKEINDHWKVSFKAGNLLDSARSRRYPDNSIFEEYRTGRTYSFAVSAEW